MHELFKRYPVVTELYCAFINSDEYNQHELTRYIDNNRADMHKAAIALAQAGDESGATDKMMSVCTEYEHTGFIFGFQAALAMLKETGTVQL